MRGTGKMAKQPKDSPAPKPDVAEGDAAHAVAHHSPPWNGTTKTIFAAASLILVALVLWRFNRLLQPLILAAVLAYLVNPIVDWLATRLGIGRGASVAIVYVTLVLVIVGFLVGVGYIAFDQTNRLAEAFPSLVQNSIDWGEQQWDVTYQVGPFTLTPSEQFTSDQIRNAANQITGWARANLTRGGTLAAQVAGTTLTALSTFFIVLFVAIYLSRDVNLFWHRIGEFAAAPGYRSDAERLVREFVRIWDSYLRGQVTLAIAMFVLVSITLTLLGVNYSLALGGIAGLLEFLPVVGPLISMVAAAMVALFQDSNWLGLSPVWYVVVVVGAMLILQQIENSVLVPRLVGGALDLHPVTVVIVVLMGTSLAGILGAILAAPVAATVKLVGAYGWRKMLDLPPFPDPEPPPDRGAVHAIRGSLMGLFGNRSSDSKETNKATLNKTEERSESQYPEID